MSRTKKEPTPAIDIISLSNKVDALNDLVIKQARDVASLQNMISQIIRDYEAHLHEIRLISGPKLFSEQVDQMIQNARNQQAQTGPPTHPES